MHGFVLIFPSSLLTYIAENMLTVLLQKSVLKAVEFTPLCVSIIPFSFSFPKVEKQNTVWYRDPYLHSHIPPLLALPLEETMENTRVSFSIVQNARWEISHIWCSAKCLHLCDLFFFFRDLFLSYRVASRLFLGN